MSDDLLDILDDSGSLVGHASRTEAHARGLWHRTAHVWVVIPPVREGSEGALLFQRRSPSKDVAPNLLDVSVGGHLAIGEDARAGAQRELAEELGIDVRRDGLRPLGVRQTSAVFGGMIDREVQTLFGVEPAVPLSRYRVQASEVAALVPIPIGRGLALFGGETDELRIDAALVGADGSTEPMTEHVTIRDFVPSRDHYFYRALVMGRRWVRGEDHLVI